MRDPSRQPTTQRSAKRERHLFVICEWDETQRYRVILRGSLQGLDVMKLKGHIERTSGVPAEDQTLVLNKRILQDQEMVVNVGLEHGAVIHLRVSNMRGQQEQPPPLPSPVPSAQSEGYQVRRREYHTPSEGSSCGFKGRVSSTNSSGCSACKKLRPDHQGRMRQMSAEIDRYLPRPNPAGVDENFAGRNDLPAVVERYHIETYKHLQDQLDDIKSAQHLHPSTFTSIHNRMTFPRPHPSEALRHVMYERDMAVHQLATVTNTLNQQTTCLASQTRSISPTRARCHC
eukprot:TRINITY_DN6237_c0_g1_i1.p1 TRINITY_DN6237_c0_g1~~TRINITY_DN6237_c0_g1_i1.p1  ORF type:complete len:287 (+),score=30.49 TRINITY_DN6237_c0_g1_i1:457-1317(+)